MSALGAAPPPLQRRKEPPTGCCRLLAPPPAGRGWEQQLQPQLQRNQQLQDVLLQREEQLLQLQEENRRLRDFLTSCSVKELQVQAQKLVARGPKRKAAPTAGGPVQNRHRAADERISRRVCRRLKFCSQESPEALDLWVLRLLGLKDEDTAAPSPGSSPVCSQARVHGPPPPTPDWVPSHSGAPSTTGAPAEAPHSSPVSSGPAECRWSPGDRKQDGPLAAGGPGSSGSRRPPAEPPAAVVFSVALSPSCSVTTHSFPQGQAFVSKDPGGRCNFTWVPRQGP